MAQQLLDWLADLVTQRRGWVVGVLLVTAAGLATQIPRIKVDPAPESLLASFEGDEYQPIDASLQEWFGAKKKVVLLLVEAPDVLDPTVLQKIQDLTLFFAGKPWVEKVDSLTNLHIPRRVKTPSEDETTLDDLDDLDSLDAEWDSDTQQDFATDVMNALLDIIESDPVRFSGGIKDVGPKLADELKTDPIVEGTTVTEDDARELGNALSQTQLLSRRMISEDHTLAAIALHIRELDPREMRVTMVELRDSLVQPEFESIKVHVGGLPYLRSSIVEKMRSDNLRLIPLTVLVCMLLLFLSFRWWPAVVLPVGAVALAALMVVGAMAVFHEPMNILNNIIVPLLIIIAIADSIHLIGRYREEVLDHGVRERASRTTVHAMAVACLLTSLTTAVGLGSLAVSRTVMLRHFGITAALGVMVAYVITITFLPAILTWTSAPKGKASDAWHGWLEGSVVAMTSRILARPKAVLAVTALFVGLSCWGATQISVDHAILDQFDESDPVYTTTVLMEEKLEGVRPLEVVLTSTSADRFQTPEVTKMVENIEAWSLTRPEVISAMSFSDILKQSLALIADDPSVLSEDFRSAQEIRGLVTMISQREPNPLSDWLTDGGRRTRIEIKLRDVGAQATLVFLNDLQSEVARVLGPNSDISVAFGGEAYTSSLGQRAVVRDLLGSLMTAVIIIFVLLTMLFRSVRLGLLSIPLNLIPLIATMAYMVIRDIPLNVSTVIIFSISLGLAVNGTIHVLARFREETARGLDSDDALLRAARGTGRAIVVSCVTLMAGFGVMLWSSFVPVRNFGELIAVTVGGCLVATLVVQPALLKVAGMSRSRIDHKTPQA